MYTQTSYFDIQYKIICDKGHFAIYYNTWVRSRNTLKVDVCTLGYLSEYWSDIRGATASKICIHLWRPPCLYKYEVKHSNLRSMKMNLISYMGSRSEMEVGLTENWKRLTKIIVGLIKETVPVTIRWIFRGYLSFGTLLRLRSASHHRLCYALFCRMMHLCTWKLAQNRDTKERFLRVQHVRFPSCQA